MPLTAFMMTASDSLGHVGPGQQAPPNRRKLLERHAAVLRHFPTAIGADDMVARVEVALAGFGFTGANSIAMTNLCRDEVCQVLKDKLEASFGSSFNVNGLGGILTCGVAGVKAGLSHSPMCKGGRERYVFFSFPHIAINSDGEVGAIVRPGRPKKSCACGALNKCLSDMKAEGLAACCRVVGVHDPLEPEYSILKQRLARRVRYEGLSVSALDLPRLTSVAERTISDDLEYLIEKAVDPSIADYAVVCGVQIHNWASELRPDGVPSLEFVAPTKVYVVKNGIKTHLDIMQVPSLSPRQLQLLAIRPLGGVLPTVVLPGLLGSVLSEVPLVYLMKKLGGANLPLQGGKEDDPTDDDCDEDESLEQGSWQWRLCKAQTRVSHSNGRPRHRHQLERDINAPTMESVHIEDVGSMDGQGSPPSDAAATIAAATVLAAATAAAITQHAASQSVSRSVSGSGTLPVAIPREQLVSAGGSGGFGSMIPGGGAAPIAPGSGGGANANGGSNTGAQMMAAAAAAASAMVAMSGRSMQRNGSMLSIAASHQEEDFSTTQSSESGGDSDSATAATDTPLAIIHVKDPKNGSAGGLVTSPSRGRLQPPSPQARSPRISMDLPAPRITDPYP